MDPETTPTLFPSSQPKPFTLVLVTLVILLLVMGLGYFLYTRFMVKPAEIAISTYAECVGTIGSQLNEASSTCVTASGQVFTLNNQTPVLPEGVVVGQVIYPPMPSPLQACPNQWVIDMEETPLPSGTLNPDGSTGVARSYLQKDEYYMLNGKKTTKSELDLTWISEHCNLQPTINLP